MFLNYLLVALQNLRRQPVFSAIKVLSLAIGLGCSILVLLHVQFATSFDRHFPEHETIFRLVTSLTTDQRLDTVMSSDAYAPALQKDYQQIEHIARVRQSAGLFARDGGESSLNPFWWAEQDILQIFAFQFLSGDPATALSEPNSVVLGEQAAAKYFPGEEPLGQVLTLDERTDLRVTGVVRDLPVNTHVEMPILISVATGRQLFGENFMGGNAWVGFGGTITYVKLPSAAEGAAIDRDLVNFVERNLPEQQRAFAGQNELTLSLEPLADIYLSPRGGFGQSTNTRAQVLTGLSVFALLILATSCINYANLSLTQIRQRAKEIGVRKTLGANSRQVVGQFLLESLLLTGLALLLALPAVWLAIPAYTALTSTAFTAATAWQSSLVWILPVFVLATGALSGLLPALAVARFEPAVIVKGIARGGRLSAWFRSGVTVLQFGFSTALVLLAVAIFLQIRHLNEMDLGFERGNLLVLDSTYSPLDSERFNFDALVNDLRAHPAVLSLAKADVAPPNTGGYNPWRRDGWAENDYRTTSHYGVDENYLETMGMRLLAGRNFSSDVPSDFMPPPRPGQQQQAGVTHSVVITRYAVRNFGFESPEDALDEILRIGQLSFRVVGVVEDFRLSGGLEDSLRSTSVLRAMQGPMRVLLLRLDAARSQEALEHIDAVWARHRPDVPVNRSFYEQTYNDLVQAQTSGIGRASLFASVITVLISAFGLYALAFYTGQRRTKEVGVRKVLGANSRSIVGLLSWDFLKPVLLACALACAAGWFAVGLYFEQFSSRASISPLVYLLVVLGTVLLALLTVAWQCLRAARADPVNSLRYE